MSKKVLSQSRFSGGIAPSEKEGLKSSYLFGRSLDYRNDPSKLTVLPRTVQETGSGVNANIQLINETDVVILSTTAVTANTFTRIRNAITMPTDDGNELDISINLGTQPVSDLILWGENINNLLYFYGNGGGLYTRDTGTSWNKIRQFTESSGNGLKYFPEDDYLYIPKDKTIARYGPIGGDPIFYENFLDTIGVPTNTFSWELDSSSSQYATVADSASLSPTGSVTFETNIKIDSALTGGESRYILEKSTSYALYLKDNGAGSANVILELTNSGSVMETTTLVPGTLIVGKWYHLAVSFDSTSSAYTLYKNGEKVDTSTGVLTDIQDSSTTLYIGTDSSTSNYFDGQLDDIRIWSDVRTLGEIVKFYQLELNSADVLDTALNAYWKLNNGYTDSSVNSNTLTPVNTPTFNTNVPFAGLPVGEDRVDIDQYENLSGNTYTTPLVISEASTEIRSFVPEKDPNKSVEVNIAAKGTGDWTITVHDNQNVLVVTKTIANADLPVSGDYEFVFDTSWRPVVGKTYHFHLTSTVADGTVVTGTASDLSTADYHTYYQYLVSDIDYHPAMTFLNYVAFGNERYVATWDGISYDPHTLILPSEYKIRSFAVVGEYLAIGTWKGTSITDFEEGKIFFWDGVSSNANVIIDIPEGGINAMTSFRNKLYFIAGSEADTFIWNGSIRKVTRTPKLTNDTHVEIFPGALSIWKALVRIGVAGNSNNTQIEKGVYTYGSKDPLYSESISYDYPISSGTRTGNDLQIGCVYPTGTELFVSWREGARYGVDSITPGGVPYDTATMEFLIFDNNKTFKDKLAIGIKAIFSPLLTGESITLKYKRNRQSNWVYSTAKVGDSEIQLSFNVTKTNMRFKEFQWALDVETSGTTPEIYNVSFFFDDLEQETSVMEL